MQSESKDLIITHGPNRLTPNSIVRTMIQDQKGMIWIASWQGVFRYDGKIFVNMTSEVSSARFFSSLEDSKGNLWFGSIGSGVYRYDGKVFQNFTTKEGLLNDEIVCIYEDKMGSIWFGANGGASRYDGNSFQNFIINEDTMMEDITGKTVASTRPSNEINAIIEDKTGKYWFATRGNTVVYDGKTFTTVKHKGEAFKNVRSLIEDKKGNIWLGGNDGLWRYDGTVFNKLTKNFVGYIHEDKKGSIWTSSESNNGWILSRYDLQSSDGEERAVTEINTAVGMIFGILEADDESIWFGGLNGVYRYDGHTIFDFKD